MSAEKSFKHLQDFHVIFPEIAQKKQFDVIDYRSLKSLKRFKEIAASSNEVVKDLDTKLFALHHLIMWDYKNTRLYTNIVNLLIKRKLYHEALYYAIRAKAVSPSVSLMLKDFVYFAHTRNKIRVN